MFDVNKNKITRKKFQMASDGKSDFKSLKPKVLCKKISK